MNCLNCSNPLESGGEYYALKLELTGAAGPWAVSEEELATAEEELARALRVAASLSEKQLRDEETRLWCRRFYPLCRKCRDRIFHHLFRGNGCATEH